MKYHSKIKEGGWDDSHRQWPLPSLPWVMQQTWNDLLFAHYPIKMDKLRSLVPEALTIDSFDDVGWIGIVPFQITKSRMKAVPPIPGISAFPELNVRTYVSVDGKPGVYFISMDTTNLLAVSGARTLYHLPYVVADMNVSYKEEFVNYDSKRLDDSGALLNCSYKPISDPYYPQKGLFDEWMAERYCLYTVNGSEEVKRCDILHEPWQLQIAEADFNLNTMLSHQSIFVENNAPILHFSKRKKVRIWPLVNPYKE